MAKSERGKRTDNEGNHGSTIASGGLEALDELLDLPDLNLYCICISSICPEWETIECKNKIAAVFRAVLPRSFTAGQTQPEEGHRHCAGGWSLGASAFREARRRHHSTSGKGTKIVFSTKRLTFFSASPCAFWSLILAVVGGKLAGNKGCWPLRTKLQMIDRSRALWTLVGFRYLKGGFFLVVDV
jgi:hypothetical protein